MRLGIEIFRNKRYNFVINGVAGSGKDTFIGIFKEYLKELPVIISNISTVDHIKEIAKEKFKWDGIKDEKGRRLLSDLKDADTRYRNGPFVEVTEFAIPFIYQQYYNKCIINFVHSRESNEIELFKKSLDNCYTILIRRNGLKKYNNHADQEVERYKKYDFIFKNYGTLDTFRSDIYRFIDLVILV